jgi:tRNA(fMet)-specific endonuclease VapC
MRSLGGEDRDRHQPYRDFTDGLPEALARFRAAEQFRVHFVVLVELLAGFLAGRTPRRGRTSTTGAQNARVLTAFLNRPRVRFLRPDEETTHQYARLWSQLKSQGTPIPANDLWIAALAIQRDLPCIVRTHTLIGFRRSPGCERTVPSLAAMGDDALARLFDSQRKGNCESCPFPQSGAFSLDGAAMKGDYP